jgi:type IV pilus assembly protein PilQ
MPHSDHARAALAKGLTLLGCLALAWVLVSCAKKETAKDPFWEEWQKKADESQGKTYHPQERKVEFSQLAVTTTNKPLEQKPARELPTMRVSLNFYGTDLQAVLRSMARIANQNIVLSQALQAPDSQAKYKVNLNVTDTPWDQAFMSILNANDLSFDWDGSIIRVMTIEDLKQQNELKKAMADKLTQQDKIQSVEQMVTVKVQVNYADVKELEATLKNYLGQGAGAGASSAGAPGTPAPGAAPGAAGPAQDSAGKIKGTVVADEHSNSIIIQAPREHAELLVKLIERLDEPRLQVHLKAYIIEAQRQTLTDLGIQWGGGLKTAGNGNRLYVTPGGDSTSPLTKNPVLGTTTPFFGGGASGRGFGLSFPANPGDLTSSTSGLGAQGAAISFMYGMLNGNLLEMQLTALASEGKINILSEPSLTTLDNQMAYTENGEKIPYVTVSQNGTNVQFLDAVLRLEMTPHVIDGKNLRMKLLVKNDEEVTDKSQWVQGNPPLLKKQTETTLIVEDGETIVISGLAKHTVSDSNQGVPGLKDIPGAGYLFKSTSKSTNMDDILVLITPTVLKRQDLALDQPGDQPTAAPAPGGKEKAPLPYAPAPAVPQGRPAGFGPTN